MMKKLILPLLGLAIILVLILVLSNNKKTEEIVKVDENPTPTPIDLCFQSKLKSSIEEAGDDEYTLIMNLDGEKVTGELNLIPAATDSKVGTFEGTVGPVDPVSMARTADLWWNSRAEGMEVVEELRIVFGEGIASVGFGEMQDRGDGVYVYKDKANLSYSLDLIDIDCTNLQNS